MDTTHGSANHDISHISLRPQARLTVSQPGDIYEREADKVAQQVMGMSDRTLQREEAPQEEEEELQLKPVGQLITPLLQREEMPEEEEEEENLQMKTATDFAIQREEIPQGEEEETLQMKAEGSQLVQRVGEGRLTASNEMADRLQSRRGGGSPLTEEVRGFMEPRFGVDFSGVRVHTDSEAVQMTKDVGAQAFTYGSDVYFGAGKLPGNNELTAHELTHVVQQNSLRVSSRIQRGLWDDIKTGAQKVGSAIKTGAQKVGSAIKTGAQKVGSAIKTGAQKVGSAIKTGATVVWNGMKWVSTQLWSKLQGIYLRAINWITQLPERVVRLILNIWQGVKSLQPWSIQWWESLGKASTWKGLLGWLGTNLIYLLEIAGVGEIYETAMDFLKFHTRPLTSGEVTKAEIVFGKAINYSLVRVDEHAALGPSWSGRAYVSFHTINSWGSLDDHTLIHELTHVWQYKQMGAIYMPKAIHAQKTGGYDYGGLRELRKRQIAGQDFMSFNLEQQGEILSDYYIGKTSGTLEATQLKTYEHFVENVRR
jgi:hypothetical protein